MCRHRFSSRPGFTRTELAVLLGVFVVLVALLMPAVNFEREAARRIRCNNQLKRIGLALHSYVNANKQLFPPAILCSAANVGTSSADPWADARLTSKGASGTSWMLCLLPYLEKERTHGAWDRNFGVSGGTNRAVATQDIVGFYCPSRRSHLRRGVDAPMMLESTWTGGGIDYGGCIGRHQGFLSNANQSVMLPSADDKLKLSFVPGVDAANETYLVFGDVSGVNATCQAERGFGVFGGVNTSNAIVKIRDGWFNTIMVGELQRIIRKTDAGPFTADSGPILSHDGWAVG